LKTAILSSAYFAPVQWYQKLNRYENIVIEQHDNFIKQTYRNRCVIATTQGLQALTIPVERPSDARLDKTQLKDICISDHGNWRHLHWKALLSAYGESPFFEYYADDIHPFFEKKYKFLLDFNMEINAKMMELLDIEKSSLSLSSEYSSYEGDSDTVDFREVIRPKHPGEDKEWQPKKYYQVYQQKFGFQPNLSILDLLFNEGNEAVYYL
jgi:hypothetical protein